MTAIQPSHHRWSWLKSVKGSRKGPADSIPYHLNAATLLAHRRCSLLNFLFSSRKSFSSTSQTTPLSSPTTVPAPILSDCLPEACTCSNADCQTCNLGPFLKFEDVGSPFGVAAAPGSVKCEQRAHEEAERARHAREFVARLELERELEAPLIWFENVDYKAKKLAARAKSMEEKERRVREGEWMGTVEVGAAGEEGCALDERVVMKVAQWKRVEWKRWEGAAGGSWSLGSSYDVFVDENECGFLGSAPL